MSDLSQKEQTSYISLVALFGLVVCLAVGLFIWSNNVDSELFESSASRPESVSSLSLDGLTGSSSSIEPEISSSELTSDPPGLEISLKDGRFVVSGVVDSFSTINDVRLAVNATYGQESSTTGLQINTNAQDVAWMDKTTEIVKSFTALPEGTLIVSEESTVLSGIAPNDSRMQSFKELLSSSNGFPPLEDKTQVLSLSPASLTVSSDAGNVTVSGSLPDQKTVQSVTAASSKMFGEENVSTDISLDENTFVRFGITRFTNKIIGFVPFKTFEAVSKEGRLYGYLQEGIEFDESGELTDISKRNIAGLSFNANNNILPVSITATGGTPEEALLRAEKIGEVFVSQKVEASRIVVGNRTGRSFDPPAIFNDGYSYEVVFG